MLGLQMKRQKLHRWTLKCTVFHRLLDHVPVVAQQHFKKSPQISLILKDSLH